MDASEFKDYIFGMLFLKRLSDAFEEEREKLIARHMSTGKIQKEAEKLAKDKDEYVESFYVPEKARWHNLKDLKHDIGTALNKATEAIEEDNRPLEGVLGAIDFNINKLNDGKLRDLLSHYSDPIFRLRNEDFERPDLLGAAYEYLIKMFADSAGKKSGEFYTPNEVVKLLVALLKPHAGMRIYDPTCGSGGMLIQTRNYLADHGENPANLHLFGQEMNLSTWAICKLNMFLHGVFSADIRKGDTLREPKHVENGELMRFDMVIANPPFGLNNWGRNIAEHDEYGRYRFGIPPDNDAVMAFIQHMIASLNQNGIMGVVAPLGVLFRSGAEEKIRKGILEDDLIEAVINLPKGLFYGTAIPAVLLIINKNKESERRNNILFVNAELNYSKNKSNILKEKDIKKITKCFHEYNEIKSFSRIISIKEVAKNNYNLVVSHYTNTSSSEFFDVYGILHGGVPIKEIQSRSAQKNLNGFDFSSILVTKDSQYYKFHSNIKTRSQIRQYLRSASDTVIQQFENWWDKYGISLAQISSEAKKSEEEIHDFLRGLGYE